MHPTPWDRSFVNWVVRRMVGNRIVVQPMVVNRIYILRIVVNRMVVQRMVLNRVEIDFQDCKKTQEFQFQKFQHNRPLNRAPLSERSHK